MISKQDTGQELRTLWKVISRKMILRTRFLEVTCYISVSRGRDKFRSCCTNSHVAIGTVSTARREPRFLKFAFARYTYMVNGNILRESRTADKGWSYRQAIGWGINNSLWFFFWRNSPQWVTASSFTTFLDHTQRRTTVGRTPLDEWSARRRGFYLTTHNT
jgi:hypothetical protein